MPKTRKMTVEAIMARRGRPARYGCFEILNPRLRYPVFVIYGPAGAYARLWEYRHLNTSPIGHWLQKRRKRPPLGEWTFPTILPRPVAQSLVRVRVELLRADGFIVPLNPPKDHRWHECRRVFQNGRAEWYRSILAASKATMNCAWS